MKKILLMILVLCSYAFGELYKVPDFQSDIFSKDGNRLKKVEMSLIFEGQDLAQNDYKIMDALNVIVSSFYLEDLFTSQGKERFKTLLKQYITKKYMMDIDFIYILKFSIKQNIDVDMLLKKLEEKIKDRSYSKTTKPLSLSKEYKEAATPTP